MYCYEWWRGFYPDDDYFKSKFETISGLQLPSSAEVIHKYASYPNILGDFDSCFVVKISSEELGSILEKTELESVNRERGCNSEETYKLVAKGKNQNDYEFMSWYLTEEGHIWGYYAQF